MGMSEHEIRELDRKTGEQMDRRKHKHKCYVFDLDGTLADLTHRLHFLEGSVKDWKGFFAACTEDTPIRPIVELANGLANQHPVIIVSGRSSEVGKQTVAWLDEYVIYNAVYMRQEGDHRPDHQVKSELLDMMLEDGWDPILMVDDRKQVVDMWRKRGYMCLQCAEGDY